MEKSKKTQVLTLSLIATLISITPLLSSSFRSTYLYFIINVLIVVLGVEAGFLSSISSSSSSSSSSSLNKNLEDDMIKNTKGGTNARTKSRVFEEEKNDMKMEEKTLVENSSVLNKKVIACVDEVKKMIKKCPSTPSMFFIGGHESDAEVEEYVQEEEEEEEEEEKVYEDDKLFVKAETFIVNFYKQLKMQREDSWKNIHGFNENNLIS